MTSEIQIRAMWDESRKWMTAAEAEETISSLIAGGFNTFIPVVWHGHGVTWPSQIVSEIDPYWTQDEFFPDPLAYLIDRCHEEGIAVIPWFTVMKNDFTSGEYDQFVDGDPTTIFNVHRPEFRSWIHSLMMEVVSNYAVDGVMMDYIRSYYNRGTHQQNDYAAKTGRVLLTDWDNRGTDQAAWDSIVAWRSDAVEAIVRTVRHSARSLRPGLPIHAWGFPGRDDLKLQGQDLVKWANAGWVEGIWNTEDVPVETIETDEIDYAMANLKDRSKHFLVANNYVSAETRPATGAELSALVDYGLALPEAQGIGVYLLNQWTDEQSVALRAGPFR